MISATLVTVPVSRLYAMRRLMSLSVLRTPVRLRWRRTHIEVAMSMSHMLPEPVIFCINDQAEWARNDKDEPSQRMTPQVNSRNFRNSFSWKARMQQAIPRVS
jgi:hypothetical protein